MTSNQIAYAAEQESERHNAAVEAETTRWNDVQESLQNRSLDLKQEELRITEDYNQQSLALKEQIEANRLAWDIAEGEAKLTLEAEYNNLYQQQLDINDRYNKEMVRIDDEKNRLEEQKIWNDDYHKTVSENLQSQVNTLREKEIEYQQRQWETENWLAFERYGLEQDKFHLDQQRYNLEAELGYASNANKMWELNLRGGELAVREKEASLAEREIRIKENKQESDIKNTKSGTFLNYSRGVTGIVDSTVNLGRGIVDIFNPFSAVKSLSGGKSYGPTNQEIFNSLFK